MDFLNAKTTACDGENPTTMDIATSIGDIAHLNTDVH